jgi:hypothetical protein
MGGNVPTEFWGFNGTAPDNKENEPFLKWLMVVAGVRNFNTASQIWFDGQFRPSTLALTVLLCSVRCRLRTLTSPNYSRLHTARTRIVSHPLMPAASSPSSRRPARAASRCYLRLATPVLHEMMESVMPTASSTASGQRRARG